MRRAGSAPPRVYKASGIRRDGTRFQPYLDLHLHHHHLGRKGDPLLIVQIVDGAAYGIALARHATYLSNEMAWLRENRAAIDWTGREALRDEVAGYGPPAV